MKRETILANDGSMLGMNVGHFDQGRSGVNPIGEAIFANDSRFVEANFSEPLTIFAVGWKDKDDLKGLLDFIAPPCPTAKRFEFAKGVNAESFLSEGDDIRAIGGSFKRVEYTSTKVNSRTYNKGLTIRVDLDNVEGMPNWKEVYTARLMQRLLRNEIRRAYALLLAAATNTAKQWSNATDKDPDLTMLGQCDAFGDVAGMNCNRVLAGFSAWTNRVQCYSIQATAGGFGGSARSTPEQVATYLGVDEFRISKERYQSSATAKSKLATADKVIFYNGDPSCTPEDSSSIKRFTSPTTGGTPFRVFEEQIGAKNYDITVEHYSHIVVTATEGIKNLTIS